MSEMGSLVGARFLVQDEDEHGDEGDFQNILLRSTTEHENGQSPLGRGKG